ncbi:hypothetical protein BDV96DRAFT_298007 [Lophiotrema nucula]|uniref:Uncharacterized protein n=1 Tax=Lophiotrema nucula TaxID=690887 RepID=A0A6A5YN68_9PLEO|nr:hypothetical protein BDV96DRAFT_298007 [Lophiotrema nucula]
MMQTRGAASFEQSERKLGSGPGLASYSTHQCVLRKSPDKGRAAGRLRYPECSSALACATCDMPHPGSPDRITLCGMSVSASSRSVPLHLPDWDMSTWASPFQARRIVGKLHAAERARPATTFSTILHVGHHGSNDRDNLLPFDSPGKMYEVLSSGALGSRSLPPAYRYPRVSIAGQ